MSYSVSIIGSGNVAIHLYRTFKQNNVSIDQVVVRTDRGDFPKELIRTDYVDLGSDFVIICVTDDQIPVVAEQLAPSETTVFAHTSGSTSIDIFEKAGHINFGSFYPLQTLSGRRPLDFTVVPLFVEGNNLPSQNKLEFLGKTVSNTVNCIASEQRLQLHLAAVFANNFTNHMAHVATSLLKKNKLDTKWIFPLIEETFLKLQQMGPELAQTGPAIRKDQVTIQRHLSSLHEKDTRDIYRLISEQIRTFSSQNK